MAEDRGQSIVVGNIAVAVAATVAVGLRFLARRLRRIPLRVDDYLILAALVGERHSRRQNSRR